MRSLILCYSQYKGSNPNLPPVWSSSLVMISLLTVACSHHLVVWLAADLDCITVLFLHLLFIIFSHFANSVFSVLEKIFQSKRFITKYPCIMKKKIVELIFGIKIFSTKQMKWFNIRLFGNFFFYILWYSTATGFSECFEKISCNSFSGIIVFPLNNY